jgi:hypothetical protein
MSVLTFVGQIFVYRMIKQFKQHIVPFVVTTRKIITVGFSLIYFNHKSSLGQVIGILLVFFIMTYEFLSEMIKDKSQSEVKYVEKVESISMEDVEDFEENEDTQNQGKTTFSR